MSRGATWWSRWRAVRTRCLPLRHENRSKRRIAVLIPALASLLAGCLDKSFSPPNVSDANVPDPSGWWVLVLGGPQFGSHVQVVRVLGTGDTGWTLQLESS